LLWEKKSVCSVLRNLESDYLVSLKISDEIFKQFPELNIGIIVVKGIDNSGKADEIENLIKTQEEQIRVNFDTSTLSQNTKIEAWRKAYSSFGAKPKKYKCSVENLYRFILGDNSLKHINKLVDIYNYISIKYIVPVGGDDLDNVDGDILLKKAKGDENFVELNSDETTNAKPGEVIYSDSKEVLCRRWNWRECNKSKMSEETKNVVLVIERLLPLKKEDVGAISKELSELVQKFCGGRLQIFILNKENKEAVF